ncbi:Zn(II)2Cys6 transcription factor [Aspergillus mulundensis]|uniref:Zn(2)-C6 fungal-type domain-containing protein n=1 Tax=Aspergillus mulundensis TaxID=1810919 RepID=A0A3D8SUW3_9EURO|nr:Uncharacterized protein DSM5745_01746 [Aspergillus mulundensis]RDW89971.1 Uncharacterized protein DSM5745_01746 [Aspergillus mulundensis]
MSPTGKDAAERVFSYNASTARHKKCDETPGACNNCVSTGRKCDGYDLSRLPVNKSTPVTHPVITSRLGWLTTADEMRSFSYFAHCSIPSLLAFFDSSLWQRVALQMSHLDRAVYHAASMLGAIHEDSCHNQMRLSGEDLSAPRHRFALEQASRSFSILNRRQASRDPQLREVVLLCCLLFVIAESLLGQYDRAVQHLRGGLRVLGEELEEQHRVSPLDRCLVETFQRLDVEFAQFGKGRPFLFNAALDTDIPSQSLQLHGPDDVYRCVIRLLHIDVPFLGLAWSLSASDIEADYDNLHRRQQQILSFAYGIKAEIRSFLSRSFHYLSYNERRRVELSLLTCLAQIVANETCLLGGLVPIDMASGFVDLLDYYESIMARYPERPTITLDNGVIPTLWMIASKCPDYSVRLQAINALLAWPHCEALCNSNVGASLALENLKAELKADDEILSFLAVSGQSHEELSHYLKKHLEFHAACCKLVNGPRGHDYSTMDQIQNSTS